ncbi:MAG: DUF1476 domain-containing protein [Rhodospirillales bacterium]
MVRDTPYGKRQEQKHVKDAELEFKIVVRRNRLLGLWAAEKMGLDGDEAAAYAKEVIQADFEEPGDEDVIRKVVKDFRDKGVTIGDGEVRGEIARQYDVARKQIASEH